MRTKLALAIGLGILCLTFLVAIKVTSLGASDRTRYLLDNVQSEVGLARTNASLLTRSYADQLTQIASLEESLLKRDQPGEVNTTFIKSDLVIAGLLEPSLQGGWKFRWKKEKSGAQDIWENGSPEKMISKIPIAGVSSSNIIWYRYVSTSGHAHYAFLIQVLMKSGAENTSDKFVAFGILNNQAFASVVENFKSTNREVMVLDDKGYALAYTSQQYVGAKMDIHPMVEHLLSQRKVLDVGEFKDRSGNNIIGAYEKLDDSNLYVLVAQKLNSFPSLFSAQVVSLFGLAVASFLVALALGFYFIRPTIAAYEYLQDFAIALGQGLPIRHPEHFVEMSPVLFQSIEKIQQSGGHVPQPIYKDHSSAPQVKVETQKTKNKVSDIEKGELYRQISTEIAQALREPINVILGQAQLARAKSEGNGVEDHYTSIEREARRARDTVDNLLKVSGENSAVHLVRTDLHEIVLSALKELRSELDQKGIHIKKDLRPVGQVMIDPIKLKTALTEILKNAIESMLESDVKDLYLATRDEGKHISLVIQDSGKGIAAEVLPKIFSPFFTTKSELGQKGLGLSVAKGILQSMSGKAFVEKTGPQGTRICLKLPLIASTVEKESINEKEKNHKAEISTDSPTDKLPQIDPIQLGGALPVTGSDADVLPSPPSEDEEIEMMALKNESLLEGLDEEASSALVKNRSLEAREKDSDLDLIDDGDVFEDELNEVAVLRAGGEDLQRENPVESTDHGFTVRIRKPKVGSGE
ncbi:MAG: sensor histidine kinase [Bdellovibrionales bacterium]|nr:sensor histidine kinase [Bdellovibrionales bacterium]